MTKRPVVVCFFGPESTGKTTMAKKMALEFNAEWVPEVSREMIDSNQFTIEDIIRIGKAQTERMLKASTGGNRLIICDTDLITTQLYSAHYLGIVPAVLHELEKRVRIDQYFLFNTDVPWVADGLRDLGDQREKMMKVFSEALTARNIQAIPVVGDYDQRTEIVRAELLRLLEN
ncbi:MAG: ATP-binding protein [Bacteroidetes bacterium]|nr:ATP-binding protein [Bacteroidota bacterium]